MSTHDIRDHGAVGDGDTDDAAAVQRAIDACAADGGGTVLVPSGGVYLAGTIRLRSHVGLHLERGAVLRASHRWEDYTERFAVGALSQGEVAADNDLTSAFITATDVVDVAITGPGVVDGNGRAFVEEDLGPIYRMPNARAFTVFLIGCRSVTLRDTTFRDGALWTIRLTGCEDVLVHGIHVDGDLKMPNCDGIDLDRCRRVRISDCSIVCGDDAISLKTCEEYAEYGPCEDVTVTGCTITTTSSGLVVGVDATDDIRRVVFDSCVISASHRGLSVNLGQRGSFSDILFSNMVVGTRIFDDRWWGRGEPIYVSAEPWQSELGTIRDVRFRNVLAHSENGVYVAGSEPGRVSGVVLEGVKVELEAWSGHPGGHYDRRPSAAREGVYAHPTSGFHVDTATDVTLRDCEVVWGPGGAPWFRHALETRRTDGLVVERFRGESADPAHPAVLHT